MLLLAGKVPLLQRDVPLKIGAFCQRRENLGEVETLHFKHVRDVGSERVPKCEPGDMDHTLCVWSLPLTPSDEGHLCLYPGATLSMTTPADLDLTRMGRLP